MCGIVGFFSIQGHDSEAALGRVERMADTLIHRGPDEEGYFVNNSVALGHRRLAIIDLSQGQQPIGSPDGRVQIVFNGEIYNFMHLRSELESRGHRFVTRCDTEVILAAYLEWGEQCVQKLNGMFAFAIWDGRTSQLFIARDRLGKKPLYYCSDGSLFAFASELKALKAGHASSTTIDPESLDCYFSFGYIPSPRTIFKEVKQLCPSRSITVSRNGQKETRYWRLSFSGSTQIDMEQATDELEFLLDDAVKSRLMSDVPLGVFLSGGVDSPLVLSSMSRMSSTPVVTNSIGFDVKDFNELPAARRIAQWFQTDHHEFVVKPNAAEVLEDIAWHFDEPFADSSAIPTWFVCKMARQNLTVALSGDGGDETFAGYTFRYIPHVLESRIRSLFAPSFRKLIFGTIGSMWSASARLPRPLRLKTIFENLSTSEPEAFYNDLIWLRSDTRRRLYSPEFSASLADFTPMDMVLSLYNENDGKDDLSRSQFTDIHFYLPEDVLTKVDRMSMAHSLEVRSPLLTTQIRGICTQNFLPTDTWHNKRQTCHLRNLRNLAGYLWICRSDPRLAFPYLLRGGSEKT